MKPLSRVAVLGAGTMGSRIAAHFANAGVAVLLLDMVLPGKPRNAAALAGIDNALKQRPAAFFTPADAALVVTGNFKDDLPRIRDCEWIIEAVAEDLEIKRGLLARVAKERAPGTVVSTNTSGLSLARIAEGFDGEFRRHFLGTHFFNPPRYLHLVEMVRGPETSPEVEAFCSEFCDLRLGKGVVPCRDTPNFIANRIGCFFGVTVHRLAIEGGYSVEEVDALTGPIIGLPKSATFRLIDIIGLDVWKQVVRNLQENAQDDPWHGRFFVPDFLERMIERGWLGEKRGQGFYKRAGGEILALDLATLEYRPARKARFPVVDAARDIGDLGARLRFLTSAPGRAGEFLWKLFSDLFLYSASMVPEIAGRIVEIDRAMRWGYAHQLGPFQYWDALGVQGTVRRMEDEGRAVPENVRVKSFYRAADVNGEPRTEYFDLPAARYVEMEPRPGILVPDEIKRARGVVKRNAGASLVDLGDGVLCLEFHGKADTPGEDAVEMVRAGVEETARNFRAMVIACGGGQFSAGTDLEPVLALARAGRWEELDAVLRRFQQAGMAVKYAPRPVVAAPFGMTLGAGCELVLHAARVQASAETYMGLTETAAGLIPAAGGSKEMLPRAAGAVAAFDLIANARVSTSAAGARRMGLLRPEDRVSMNPERLLGDAKALALELAPGWSPGSPREDIPAAGAAGYEALKNAVDQEREAESITSHDAAVREKLAWVLTGGGVTGAVSEQRLLDLEREAFLSLCGQAATQERIEHLLRTGKPLRN